MFSDYIVDVHEQIYRITCKLNDYTVFIRYKFPHIFFGGVVHVAGRRTALLNTTTTSLLFPVAMRLNYGMRTMKLLPHLLMSAKSTDHLIRPLE